MKTIMAAALVLIPLSGSIALAGNTCGRPVARPATAICQPHETHGPHSRSRHDGGSWAWQEQRQWVPGTWVATYDRCGRQQRSWQPGHWESRWVRVQLHNRGGYRRG